MNIPIKAGLYIAITPKVLAIIKVTNVSPYLEISSGINLIDFWRTDKTVRLLDTELAYIKTCAMKKKLVVLPICSKEDYEEFDISDIPLPRIEFNDDDIKDWSDTYAICKQTGEPSDTIINTIMFSGPYTTAQAKSIYTYIENKYNRRH